jgi:hypothetical protein
MSTEEKKTGSTEETTTTTGPNPRVLNLSTMEEIKKHGLRPQKGSLPDLARRGLWPKPIEIQKTSVSLGWGSIYSSGSPYSPRSPSPKDTHNMWWEEEMDKACDAWWEARMKGVDYPAPWIELPVHLKPGYVSPLPDYKEKKYPSDSDDEYWQEQEEDYNNN